MKNFLTKMLDTLTSAYSRKDHDNQQQLLPLETNIGKLFSVFAWGLDSVQEQAELIWLWDDLEYARGSVLDRYGANFGVKRISSDDRFYRLTIKVKLLAQLSGGDIDTVLNAAAELFEIPVEQIALDEVFPSKICLIIQEADLSPETFVSIKNLKAMIKRILAAGIGIDLNIVLKPPPFQESAGDLYLHRLRMMATFCNIRNMPVQFNGAIDFDGAVQFDQAFKGFLHQRFLVRVEFTTLQSGMAIRFDSAVAFDGSTLFNQEFGITHLTMFKARLPMRSAPERLSYPIFRIGVAANELRKDLRFPGMAIRVSVTHKETTGGELTMDNWRIFDGDISFEGFRQFDAYYVKEEI